MKNIFIVGVVIILGESRITKNPNFPTNLLLFLPVLCLYKSIAHSEEEDENGNAFPEAAGQSATAFKKSSKSSLDRSDLERELAELKQRLKQMERQLISMEKRTPSKYPDVKFLNYQTRKRILITGGAGFVGSHLVDSLMQAGHEVIVADNFFTGRKRNVEHWLGHENFELIHHDIVNALFIEVCYFKIYKVGDGKGIWQLLKQMQIFGN